MLRGDRQNILMYEKVHMQITWAELNSRLNRARSEMVYRLDFFDRLENIPPFFLADCHTGMVIPVLLFPHFALCLTL